MEFEYSKKTKMYMEQLADFMTKYIYPNEKVFHDQLNAGSTRWQIPPIMEELKATARERGLWNLFLPESERGAGPTNLEYAPLCEIMGRSPIAPEAFNCSAPDTGNMETIERYGAPEQKKQWLQPLLEGKIRSAFVMTTIAVLSVVITPNTEPVLLSTTVIVELPPPQALRVNAALAALSATMKRDLALKPVNLMALLLASWAQMASLQGA